MKPVFLAVGIGLLFPVSFVHANDSAVLGTWTPADKLSRIEISRCDEGLCGKIVWLKEPRYSGQGDPDLAGKAKTDRNNPDPTKHKNPILGLQILKGFRTRRGNVWEDGTIYDPNNGKTYQCRLTLVNPNRLNIRGYIRFFWLGQTAIWTRWSGRTVHAGRSVTRSLPDSSAADY